MMFEMELLPNSPLFSATTTPLSIASRGQESFEDSVKSGTSVESSGVIPMSFDDSDGFGVMTPLSSSSPSPNRKKKKKKRLVASLSCSTFKDIYRLTGEILGEGSYGQVQTCVNVFTDVEFAVKIIHKSSWYFSRAKVLKEIELYYLCQGQNEIIQLIEFFEEDECFYLIFEKMYGGPLLDQIQKRIRFTEKEACSIIHDLTVALRFLHERGIAHRDIKPENILCVNQNSPYPIKLCDFDLCSAVYQTISTPRLQSPVGSAEYMAPEIVQAFTFNCGDNDFEDELTYDKRCDLWSLGIIMYILLCGYMPFSGSCGRQDCGWDSGEECPECQHKLFSAIKDGTLVFPGEHWNSISKEAKDLISKLLVKEASERIDAVDVLDHPWIVSGGSPKKVLETPGVLKKIPAVRNKVLRTSLQYCHQQPKAARGTHMKRQTSMIFPEEIHYKILQNML